MNTKQGIDMKLTIMGQRIAELRQVEGISPEEMASRTGSVPNTNTGE